VEPDLGGDPDVYEDGVIEPTGPAIAVRQLKLLLRPKVGGPKQVLFDIDLDIWPGEVALKTGPSGCGKTTLLTLIGGLRTVQSTGDSLFSAITCMACAVGELPEVRRRIGFIFPMHNLLDFLTARQNVQMALQLHAEFSREEMEARAEQTLDLVGLGRHPGFLPGSAIGRTEAAGLDCQGTGRPPKLILADEPTSALDSKTGREVIDLLVHLARDQRCPVLMVTHDMRIADMANRIIKMEDGRIASG